MLVPMMLVALTGGIAAGKSTIAERFRDRGAYIIDADRLAREVVEPGEAALDRIVAVFGSEVLSSDGSLDRPRLAALVFGDKKRLEQLNRIMHPAIRQRGDERVAHIREQDPSGIVIYDIPLLVEGNDDREWDAIVVAEAPDDVRVHRLVTLRGMTEADARARLRHQASNEERRQVADYLIDTSGSIESTLEQVDAIWEELNRIRSQTR